jgi:putative ABC transport system permease protein
MRAVADVDPGGVGMHHAQAGVLDPEPTPFLLDVTLNIKVLAFTLIVAMLTEIGFTLLPAMRATAHAVAFAPALRTSDIRVRQGRMTTGGSVLVASQIALCVLLLVAAGLLTRSLLNLKTVDAGFDRGQMVLADVNTTGSEFSPARRMTLYDSVLERVHLLPGVLSVASSTRTPIDFSSRVNRIVVPGANVQGFHGVSPNIVSPEYFRTFGIRLVRGRPFTHDDGRDRPKVAVVSESMARFYFGEAQPLGRSFTLGTPEPITIVGVVEDVRHERLTEQEPLKMVYTPLAQTFSSVITDAESPVPTRITVAVRATENPLALGAALQAEVRRLDRVAVVTYVRTLEQQLDAALVRERLLAVLSAGFSALALLLACVGVYGTLSYTVVRRSREIGIRMALGAARATVVRQILRQCLVTAGWGVLVGVIVALWASRALSAFLYELSPRDPLTLTATIALLLVTAGAAGYLPARRAARVDPARVLKAE